MVTSRFLFRLDDGKKCFLTVSVLHHGTSLVYVRFRLCIHMCVLNLSSYPSLSRFQVSELEQDIDCTHSQWVFSGTVMVRPPGQRYSMVFSL